MTNSKAIAEALDIEDFEPVVEAKQELIVLSLPPEELNSDTKEDYELSRNTFRALIRQGNEAIDGINELAKQSESPRAYEVLATLMKTVADTTKDLYDLQKKTKELSGVNKKTEQTNVNVEKAVFVGTTTDLLKKIKEQKNEEV